MTDPILDPNHIANRILRGSVGWFDLQEAHKTIVQQHIKSEADAVALGILRRNRDIAFNEGVEEAAKAAEEYTGVHEDSELRIADRIRTLKRPT